LTAFLIISGNEYTTGCITIQVTLSDFDMVRTPLNLFEINSFVFFCVGTSTFPIYVIHTSLHFIFPCFHRPHFN